jgi:hypothetical protein
MTARRRRVRPPDVEIGAAARLRRFRVEREPETEVRFGGDLEQGVSASERENLPPKLESGEEYANAKIRWRAAGWLDDPTDEEDER